MSATYTRRDHFAEPSTISRWIRSSEVRESFESILIAVLLALMFRYFEAEAFVIPTGSMAPDLQGDHLDLECPQCQYHYLTGASPDADGHPAKVISTGCPMCGFELELKPTQFREHKSWSGDRILVNKFAYDFSPPQRWDVIVFKYPFNGKQNFIKRLIGLPGESILIERGDIYTYDSANGSFDNRKIARKPPRKLEPMLMIVDDTDYFPETLESSGWPSLWNQWNNSGTKPVWKRNYDKGHQSFAISPSTDAKWLRYRHLKPRSTDWKEFNSGISGTRLSRLAAGVPTGELITDYFAYNDSSNYFIQRRPGGAVDQMQKYKTENGMHWVGDLGLCAWIESRSDVGTVMLQTVEGGAAFTCSVDLATGQATFSVTGDDSVKFDQLPTAETSIRGRGSWKLQFANADDKLFLWVDGKSIEIAGSEYTRTGPVVPVYRKDGPSDSEPIGIGGSNVELIVTRLQVLRDLYYTSKNNSAELDSNTRPQIEYIGFQDAKTIESVLRNPDTWDSTLARDLFASRNRDEKYVFKLTEHQLLPMGDNSPQSSDARIWNGERFVDDSYLLGKALFIYWPHAKSKPVPFWPNFERMKLIR